MRPNLLDPLFAPAASLPGVGPKTGKLLDRLLVEASGQDASRGTSHARVVDLLFHLPHATVDRRNRPKIADAPLDQIVTIEAKVVDHQPPGPRSKAPYKVLVEDETGDILLVFFLANPQWIERSLPLGETRWVSGKLELWDGHRQMVHPDRVLDAAGLAKLPPVEPVYGLTEGLYQKILSKAIAAALTRLPVLPEWHRYEAVELPNMLSFGEALKRVHEPQDPADIAPMSPARLRLAYDELLAHQLSLMLVRASMRQRGGRAHEERGEIAAKIAAALPFALTGAQVQAREDIRRDLTAPTRMLRLLQGDVGSGKTVVALFAMAHVVEAGRQAALMAPTEILARQHYEGMAGLTGAAGLRLALLTGRDKASERARTLAALAAGEIDIVIGTHALFQEAVSFRDLGLAIVDEQHRFGVHQRLALGEKGAAVDILVMTATPIPRTLVLSYFGDMDISTLREKPPGRQSIDTRALPLDRLDEVIERLAEAIASGARAYWVCPLVAESEELDVAAAEERFDLLSQFFGNKVGLVHGKMKAQDKDRAMARFATGETQILVATTVIEVGVDVPEATIIIIEHAERFGLAQLHQLRGRVGRGSAKSSCVLLYKTPLGETAKARINVMRETQDGFLIAEEDLRLRGEGEVLGTRQSGAPGFRLAQLDVHGDLLALARAEAQQVMSANPKLEGEAGQALRLLLYLFERDAAVKLLQAG
ncbi:ATP-dependent DNA helicase RecG [Methylovirgula sp. HY1]|uniref:ATP-dependent DNA helicase RecG n=1 Tax=Methylovirgula sp. HY1 TaxID=2822761 RepID=UPI001C5B5880|nr:ATP-dependent DNA helicase RecG [Methylovirgula sp. HY1]QXX76392.1 ATP-dependent DNA helicase RecG [Methylovirgula sp. HY1]